MADLNALPYLDNVVPESMLIHPAASHVIREATHEVRTPVSKSFKDLREGAKLHHISRTYLLYRTS
jgi:hypothetical protein